ncbi:MAG: PilZ domain-containing protein [Candidatus Lambdaproteobacteria bacterium]|nr:PilZ domain-containing protein [Candidatus Lambdaproteobacteria bacterium]
MSGDAAENRRTQRRSTFVERYTSVEINGKMVRVRVVDLSEGGMRLVLPPDVMVSPDDEVNVAIDKVIPNVRGRVRWVSPDASAAGAKMLGLKFESFMINPVEEHEVQDLIDAWMDVSQAFNDLDRFVRIVELIDNEIIDGKIDDISEAVVSVTVWLERNVAPLNLWTVIHDEGHEPVTALTVERNKLAGYEMAGRAAIAQQAAMSRMTIWADERAYFYGETVVMECIGELGKNADLLQHVAIMLGRKIPLWSKLLIKNIALRLLADELDRLRESV